MLNPQDLPLQAPWIIWVVVLVLIIISFLHKGE